MTSPVSQRVVVFLDYQNVYHRARDAFCSPRASANEGQVDPVALGHLLAARVPGGSLTGVRVYRGRPSQRRDPRSHAACRRQSARQVSRGGGLVVGILFSSDTDLVPALEAVLALRPGDRACEVAAWAAPGRRPRSLSVRGASIRSHLLTQADYRSVADLSDYTCTE